MRFKSLLLILLFMLGGPIMTTSCSSSGEQQQQEDLLESDDNQQEDEDFQEEDDQEENIQENEENGADNLNLDNSAFTEDGNINQFPDASEESQTGLGEGGDLQQVIEEMNNLGGDQFAQQDTSPMSQEFESIPSESPGIMSSSPLPPGLPEMGSKMSYIVLRGDTLSKIATKIYGRASKWVEIADFTALANPKLIYPGDVVYYQLTDETLSFASRYESSARSSVVVRQGDSLSNIAERVLGNPSYWKMIWRQNDSIKNPDTLIVGTTLYYTDPGNSSAALDPLGNKDERIADSTKNSVDQDSFEVELSDLDYGVQKQVDQAASIVPIDRQFESKKIYRFSETSSSSEVMI